MVKQARDGAVYNRQQTGHSLIKHLVGGAFIGYLNFPWILYYTFSPNHFWHT